MKMVPWLGWLVFALATACFISGYGTHWDLSGRYGMPTTLFSPDGQSYRDGSPVDPVTLAIARQGIEQEARLVALGVLLVLFTVLAFQMRRFYRNQLTFDRELRRIRGMRPQDDERG